MTKYFTAIAAGLFPIAAFASVLIGNPTSGIVVIDGNDIYVDSVTAVGCNSNTPTVTIDIDKTLDEGEDVPVVLSQGYYCSMKVKLQWEGSSENKTVAVDGFSIFKAVNGAQTVAIELDGSIEQAYLN